MILSNSALFEALDERRIIIDPEPAPRNPRDDPDSEWPYATTAVDLRLGDEVSWFNEGLAVNIDLRRGKFANLFGPNSSSRRITGDQPYALMPAKLVLANTLERVERTMSRTAEVIGHTQNIARGVAGSSGGERSNVRSVKDTLTDGGEAVVRNGSNESDR